MPNKELFAATPEYSVDLNAITSMLQSDVPDTPVSQFAERLKAKYDTEIEQALYEREQEEAKAVEAEEKEADSFNPWISASGEGFGLPGGAMDYEGKIIKRTAESAQLTARSGLANIAKYISSEATVTPEDVAIQKKRKSLGQDEIVGLPIGDVEVTDEDIKEAANLNKSNAIIGSLESVRRTQEAILSQHPEWAENQIELSIDTFLDPAYLGQTMGMLVPYMLGAISSGLVGLVASGGNPGGAVAGAAAFTYVAEAGNSYTDLVDNGVPEAEALKIARLVGSANAALEVIPGSEFMKNPGVRAVLSKVMARKMVEKGATKAASRAVLRQAVAEGVTEMLQEIPVMIGELSYKDISPEEFVKRIVESGYAGLIGGASMGAGAASFSSASNQVKTDKVTERVRKTIDVLPDEVKRNLPQEIKDQFGITGEATKPSDGMSYSDMVSYVKENELTPSSRKKVDLAKAIDEFESQGLDTAGSIKALNEELLKMKRPLVKPVAENRESRKMSRFVKDVLGIDLVYVDGLIGANGVYIPKAGKTVFVSSQRDSSNPLLSVIGHEWTHSLERNNPGLYGRLLDVIKDVDPKKLEQKLNEYNSILEENAKELGEQYTPATLEQFQREIIGDFVGEQMLKRPFWESVYKRNPFVLDNLHRFIRKAISKITGQVSDLNRTEELFSESLEKASKIAADVVAKAKAGAAKLSVADKADVINAGWDEHTFSGGSTISPVFGNMAGQDYTAVAIPLKGAKNIVVKGRGSKADYISFIEDNWDLVSKNPELSFGSWYDSDANETTYEVSVTLPEADVADALARKYNQKSSFRLLTFEEIDTGGNGQAEEVSFADVKSDILALGGTMKPQLKRIKKPANLPGKPGGVPMFQISAMAQKTTPSKSYMDGVKSSEVSATNNNVWVKREDGDNSDRTLMVQFSSRHMSDASEAADESTKYFDKLYSGTREGYSRPGETKNSPPDFWEIPTWAAEIAGNLGKKADFYVVRSVAEFHEFVKTAGYGEISFSVLDVTKDKVAKAINAIPKTTKVILGGYADNLKGLGTGKRNVKIYSSTQAYVESKGLKYGKKYDYSIWNGSNTIPRLCLSLGCKHHCAFCDVALRGKTKAIPTDEIFAQLDAFKDLNADLIYLDDKTFGQADNYKLLPEIYERYLELNPNFLGFIIQTTATAMNFKRFPADYLVNSGIKYVELGAETFNDPILRVFNKPATEKAIADATAWIRSNGMSLIPNVLVGSHWTADMAEKAISRYNLQGDAATTLRALEETQETYDNTLAFLEENKDIISHLNVYNLVAYQDTELGQSVGDKGEVDENMVRTYLQDVGLHRRMYERFTKWASDALDKQPQGTERKLPVQREYTLTHFSNQKLDVLSGAGARAAGTIGKTGGAETKRLATDGIHFYLPGATVEPDFANAGTYRYDFVGPLRLYEAKRAPIVERQRVAAKIRELQNGMPPSFDYYDNFEKALVALGYDGFVAPQAGAAKVYSDVKAKRVKIENRDEAIKFQVSKVADSAERAVEKAMREEAFDVAQPAFQVKPIWYSALTRAVEGLQQKKAPAAQWLGMIMKQPGVKKEELEWTDLENWLSSQDGTIERDEIVSFLKANAVQVTEVTLGGEGIIVEESDSDPGIYNIYRSDDPTGRMTGIMGQIIESQGEYKLFAEDNSGMAWVVRGGYEGGPADLVGTVINSNHNPDFPGAKAATAEEAIAIVKKTLDTDDSKMVKYYRLNVPGMGINRTFKTLNDAKKYVDSRSSMGSNTKFETYVTPGGENYRELLLTLPVDKSQEAYILKDEGQGQWSYNIPGAEASRIYNSREEAMLAGERRVSQLKSYPINTFRSSHFNEPNILAHIRFDERTDSEGRRVLHIAEVQSDWHQAGRKRGYREDTIEAVRLAKIELDNLKNERNKIERKAKEKWEEEAKKEGLDVEASKRVLDKFTASQLVEAAGMYREWAENNIKLSQAKDALYSAEKGGEGVPNAPFKTTWPLLAMKRMIRYASENGFDAITWDPGIEQVKRYENALRRSVDRVEWGTIAKNDKQVQKRIAALVDEYESVSMAHPERGHEISSEIESLTATAPGYATVVARKDGHVVFSERFNKTSGISEREIEGENRSLNDVVGKAIATRILSEETGDISGTDLTIGGEGMKGFYDRILPNEINKYVKKWGGKVGQSSIITPRTGRRVIDYYSVYNEAGELKLAEVTQEVAESFVLRNPSYHMQYSTSQTGDVQLAGAPTQVPSLAITPQMKEVALSGQPMFQIRPEGRSKFEDVQERIDAARGAPEKSWVEGFKKKATEIKNDFTRHFKEIDPKIYGHITNIMRVAESAREAAVEKTQNRLIEIAGSLDATEYQNFTMNLILPDMLSDIKKNEVKLADGETYQFGYTSVAQIKEDLKHFKSNQSEAVKKALALREEVMTALKEELVRYKILPKSVLDEKEYFHRQVLEYMSMEGKNTSGTVLGLRQGRKSWAKARTGSTKDFNTEYLESEYEVMAGGYEAIAIAKSMAAIKQEADISKTLRKLAKENGTTLNEEIPDGYVKWSPQVGTRWFKAITVDQKIAQEIMADGAGEVGLHELGTAMARAAKETWVIPEDLAEALDNFKTYQSQGVFADISQGIQNKWKQWILLNPYRATKYMLNNVSGDTDIVLAYDPAIMRFVPQAIRDLHKYVYHKGKVNKELKAEIEKATESGVVNSGITIQEIPDVTKELGRDEFLKQFHTDGNIMSKYGPLTYWNKVKKFNNFRENILRLAALRYFEIKVAERNDVYGASNKEEIDDIQDKYQKASKLARELVGDYGNLTQAGQFIRRQLIPFYSWMEINLPRYVRLMNNVSVEGRGRAAAIAGKKVVFKATGLAARMAGMYLAISIWNATFFPDEEEELGRSGRRQLHLILGRREDGSIRSLRVQGAFSDAMSWFGLEHPAGTIKSMKDGELELTDFLADAAKAAPTKIFLGARPFEKALFETLSGKSYFPDPLNPRPIRDKVEHISRLFSLDGIYRAAKGRPTRERTIIEKAIRSIEKLVLYSTDPGESAFWDAKAHMYDWLEKKGVERGSGGVTSRGTALYYYKQAVKYQDLKAALKFYKKYIELGGTDKAAEQSIKMLEPIKSIPSKLRDEYIDSLSDKQIAILIAANKWYSQTYLEEK